MFQIIHRTLAAQLCGIFVSVEKDNFESRLKEIVPVLLKQFHANFDDRDEPGRFVKLQSQQTTRFEMQSNIKDPERMKDHHMFQVLQLLLKISANCSAFLKNEEYKESVRLFAGEFNVIIHNSLVLMQRFCITFNIFARISSTLINKFCARFRIQSIVVGISSSVGSFISLSDVRFHISCSR